MREGRGGMEQCSSLFGGVTKVTLINYGSSKDSMTCINWTLQQ